MSSVGVVGTGAMGLGVVRALRERGFEVYVRDVIGEREAQAVSLGAVACATPAEVARRAPVVVTLVVDAAQTEDVLFGEAGVASGLRPGHAVMMCSTIAPADVAAYASRLARESRLMLDAPVSGGPARARDGSLSMMAAGAPEAFARCEAVIAATSAVCFRVSERPGDGSRMKVVNNMLAAANLAAGCEAMAMASKLGLDLRLTREVVNASSGASWMFADRMARALEGDYAPRAAARLLTKDVGLFVEAARELGVDAPMAATARRIFLDTIERGFGEEDDAAVLKRYAEAFGARL